MIDQAHSLRQEATRQGRAELAKRLSDAITAYEDKKLRALLFKQLIRDAEQELANA